jgi:hypothetical protein
MPNLRIAVDDNLGLAAVITRPSSAQVRGSTTTATSE